jgi:glycosyltransferase involved in cell wall biosynthesis
MDEQQMKILYISGAMKDSDFNSYVKNAKYHLNPSNQNFHYRFLKSLSTQSEITALTLRPFYKGLLEVNELKSEISKDESITFKYLPDKSDRLYKLLLRHNKLTRIIANEIAALGDDVVILIDSMKFALAKAAISAAKKTRAKVYAIVTDNPKLLSNESFLYTRAIYSLYKKYDGFISLTSGLNEMANKHNKPAYVFSGFAEVLPELPNFEKKPYFFFCGALYERYGILNMIEAFKQIKTEHQLLLAGHGPLISKINESSSKDSRIRYLGLLSRNEIQSYEQHADLNINPRLYEQFLDKYSVPSKVLEYLASGVPLLSTLHTNLRDEFCGEAIWVKDGSVDELRKAMELFIQIQNGDMKKKAQLAKKKVLAKYGLENQGKLLYNFLLSNSSRSIA